MMKQSAQDAIRRQADAASSLSCLEGHGPGALSIGEGDRLQGHRTGPRRLLRPRCPSGDLTGSDAAVNGRGVWDQDLTAQGEARERELLVRAVSYTKRVTCPIVTG